MALPLCILVSVVGRRSQRPGPSPTLGSLGPSHQRRHKSRVSLRGPPCAHGVSGTPHGEVRDNTPTTRRVFHRVFSSCFIAVRISFKKFLSSASRSSSTSISNREVINSFRRLSASDTIVFRPG